ncbi:MAG: site-2 protease family protein [Lachnospiraceae bacterium]|nr:site-2 protease family protein [Lachnospiraceae bacterium]
MIRHDSDPFIDLSFFSVFLGVLAIFVVSFLKLFYPDSPGFSPSGTSPPDTVFGGVFAVALGALLSVAIFTLLLAVSVIVHELGHLAGGLLTGYRLRHFCLFGVVLSARGSTHVRFDRSALFGGYVVMCTDDPGRSPVALLRAGPLAECTLMLSAAVAAVFLLSPVTGVFVLGEILSFLLVRSLTTGRSACGDSATTAQVRTEGPADYNRLMDIYDRELKDCGREVPAGKDHGEPSAGDDVTEKRELPANLTVKEELSLYVKKE